MESLSPAEGGQHRSPARRGVAPALVLFVLAAVLIIIAGVGAVYVIAHKPGTSRFSSHGRPRPAVPRASGSGASTSCVYVPTVETSATNRHVTLPDPHPTRGATTRVRLVTSEGAIEIELAADAAPCAVNSFLTLARARFFTGTHCHRLTTSLIYVLQCGDPSGSGTGGPGYRFADENLPTGRKPAYPKGTVAMANGGPGTNGSQFFLVYRDSEIDPNYPVFGTISTGLDVLEKIAAYGADDANGPGDGHPKVDVLVSEVTPTS